LIMRHFGNVHYGGWYKKNNASHERYYTFLGRLRDEFDNRGLWRKRDAVSKMRLKLNQGKTPKQAQSASKTSGGYAPPLFSDFNSAWEATSDMEALVEAFASGDDVAVMSDDGDFETTSGGINLVEMGVTGAETKDYDRTAERQARLARGETFQSRGAQAASLDAEEESFFARYKTPIVIGSALALAGGAYYFFVVRD